MKDFKRDLQNFYHESILLFYRAGLATQGKTIDDVFFDNRGKKFWQNKNARCRIFGRKLNQLLKER